MTLEGGISLNAMEDAFKKLQAISSENLDASAVFSAATSSYHTGKFTEALHLSAIILGYHPDLAIPGSNKKSSDAAILHAHSCWKAGLRTEEALMHLISAIKNDENNKFSDSWQLLVELAVPLLGKILDQKHDSNMQDF